MFIAKLSLVKINYIEGACMNVKTVTFCLVSFFSSHLVVAQEARAYSDLSEGIEVSVEELQDYLEEIKGLSTKQNEGGLRTKINESDISKLIEMREKLSKIEIGLEGEDGIKVAKEIREEIKRLIEEGSLEAFHDPCLLNPNLPVCVDSGP